MSKIFGAVASNLGVEISALRFLFDGHKIAADNTPKMLEMEDMDQIECMTEQTGGKS
jgi:small ubiquitin-related modifier